MATCKSCFYGTTWAEQTDRQHTIDFGAFRQHKGRTHLIASYGPVRWILVMRRKWPRAVFKAEIAAHLICTRNDRTQIADLRFL